MKRNSKHRIFYFGADMPWAQLIDHGFRRRNTSLLKSLVNNKNIDKVFVLNLVSRKEFFKNIFSGKKKFNKVKDISLVFLLPQVKHFPIAAKINSLFIQLLILLYTGSLNKESDILWIYWTKAYLFAKKTKMQGRIFFDIDHNIIDDVNTENKKKLEEILTDIGNRAERILSGSRSMIEWYEKRDYHNNIYLRNGVDSERFDKLYNTPPEMANINKPRILYVGTLSKWINSDLLINLIKRNKKWNFIFLGNNYKSNISVLLGKQANVTMLGHKNAEEVPAYMTNSDIALGMYKNEKWLDVDSMKFYEYIASGLAVISTKYHQYIEEDFNKLVETYDGINDIENAINIQIQLNGSQKEIRLNKASNFISKNTWDNRIKHIIQYF